MNRSHAGVLGLLIALTCSALSAQTIILVRHAEKAETPKEDPALSEAGQRRAEALASALSGARVTAIFTTQARRTRDTAAPLARQAGITPRVLEVSRAGLNEHVAETARLARETVEGVVVIVGHSNTVPAIARALGVAANDMPECEYSRMTLVQPKGETRVIVSRYGAADPPCP